MSIMPLLIAAPMKTPMEAIISTRLKDAAREPIAEFRKFTASLLTPTERSNTASNEQEDYHTKEKCFHKYKFGFMFLQRKSTAGMFQNVTFRINGG